MVTRTAFITRLDLSLCLLPRTTMESPGLAEVPVNPERSVWPGLLRSTCQTTPSAAFTCSEGCGGAMETFCTVPFISVCSACAQSQPWCARAGRVTAARDAERVAA